MDKLYVPTEHYNAWADGVLYEFNVFLDPRVAYLSRLRLSTKAVIQLAVLSLNPSFSPFLHIFENLFV